MNKRSHFYLVKKSFFIFSIAGMMIPWIMCAQTELLPLEHSFSNRLTRTIYNSTKGIHSSIQPYELRDMASGNNLDSVICVGHIVDSSGENWLYRKIFNEHLLEVSTEDYRLYVDFLPNLQVERDVIDGRGSMVNTRGFSICGHITNRLSFTSEFYENQAKFPAYIDAFVRKYSVIPGQGYKKYYDPETFDFGYSNAVISVRPSKYLGIQGGQGKNFIGDGYRSMLLSDASFNYPFLKLTADVWKLKYMCLWTEFQDLRDYSRHDQFAWKKKNGVFHYLDINLSSRFSLGLFEGIIWLPQDSTFNRGFEWNYLNPIIFLRPVEFSLSSPDNVVMGLNWRYILSDHTSLYGQVMIDELTIGEYVKARGYWANKYGIQVGVKSFEPADIRDLYLQTEFNCASPYTYSHKDPMKSYSHYNQPLAHPMGANFYESVSIAQYSIGRIDLYAQVNVARYGDDSSKVSFGKDVYKSYDARVSDFGTYITQGVKTDLLYGDLRIAYVLNPLTNLRVELGGTYRRLHSSSGTQESMVVSLGLRSSFRNLYYDF